MTDINLDSKFNGNSYLSMGIVVLLITGTLWIKQGQSEVAIANKETATDLANYKQATLRDQSNEKELSKMRLDVILAKVDGIQKSLELDTGDRFRRSDHKVFVERLKELNPTIKFPAEL